MLLSLSKINKSFSERVLFEDVSFSVAENDKIGLVGANGCGKTTLFKIILGETDFSGDIFKNKDIRIAHLEQQTNLKSDKTVLDEVLSVFEHLKKTEAELTEINSLLCSTSHDTDALIKKQHELNDYYEKSGGYTYKSRARAALLGLGFSEKDLSMNFNDLSGGQKTRVCLCKVLLEGADILMLDEPTNHLDLESSAWLEGFLKEQKCAVIIISHDRYFLDKVTNRTFEISNKLLTTYEGNYTRHIEIKREREKTLLRAYENTQKEIERLEAVITEQKRWNKEKSVKRAESKQKAVDKLKNGLVKPPEKEKTIRFEFGLKKESGNDVVIANNLSMSFSDNPLFENVNIHIRKGEKVFLTGANGSGKTTLFKIINGIYNQTSGELNLGAGVDIGYYDQTQGSLSGTKTVFEEIADSFPKKTQTEIRNALASFLFFGDDVFKTINTLSGGERTRVLLLKLMLSGANFLLLDEPTNHLDIASREMLEDALTNYTGTILAVSHDRYFMNKLAMRVLSMEEKSVVSYQGNSDYYAEKKAQQVKISTSDAGKTSAPKSKSAISYKEKKEHEALVRKLKNTLLKTEQKINELEEKISDFEARLLSPEIASDYVKASELTEEIEKMNEALQCSYELWEETETALSKETNDLD